MLVEKTHSTVDNSFAMIVVHGGLELEPTSLTCERWRKAKGLFGRGLFGRSNLYPEENAKSIREGTLCECNQQNRESELRKREDREGANTDPKYVGTKGHRDRNRKLDCMAMTPQNFQDDLEVEGVELCEAVELGGQWVIENRKEMKPQPSACDEGGEEEKAVNKYFEAAFQAFEEKEESLRKQGEERWERFVSFLHAIDHYREQLEYHSEQCRVDKAGPALFQRMLLQ